ncbi:protein kinase G11A-like [Dendrobium catenatum]|uniref:non-specific serine/threonine protein kinase n=1 Tax=Dendrobium catenatum TaxID=906689 RepID=A0A2I0X137_9ASPA|nr:protein kinase G11A-like [Dendrobium catenatum]PKU81626.1 Protein kinase G11A [Dendrobium catenatum]
MPIVLANNLHSSKFDSDNVSPFSTASGCSSSAPSSIARPQLVSGTDPCDAIRRLIGSNGSIAISDLRAIQRLGSGDIGSVYLAEIKTCGGGGGGRVLVAAKVMDKGELEGRNKSARAKTEREILEMLDHPFLPKLYGCAENDKLTCLLTEFCPGGDLHLLRQRQPGKRFDEHAVRFYAAELVVALEYLHVLGIIYRDLKPENVLVRSDGHIMLTDFDLSLKSEYGCSPTAQFVRGPRPSSSPSTTSAHRTNSCNHFPNCIVPGVSCFHSKRGNRKKPARLGGPTDGLEFVAEPVDLRSMSFVGTHEYLAPEIVAGEGHGSAVDWWTLGVFIYELLYGVTPFKGLNEDRTLANIVARGLEFPKEPAVSSAARELISGLLVKDPAKRLGSTTGAAAVKRHSFFGGVSWALLRCEVPPHVPPAFSVDGGSSGELTDDSSAEAPVEYY